jgi:hypothetical protein
MASRPKVFELEQIKADLIKLGVSERSVEPTISAMRLIIPAVIRELGEDGIIEILERMSREWSHSENSRWKQMLPDIVAWANGVLEDYKDARSGLSSTVNKA